MARKSINIAAAPEAEQVLSRRPTNAAAQLEAQPVPAQVAVGKIVTVRIPKNYSLTLDDHTQVHYKAGIDEMPIEHANHWYLKVAGVEIHEPKRSL